MRAAHALGLASAARVNSVHWWHARSEEIARKEPWAPCASDPGTCVASGCWHLSCNLQQLLSRRWPTPSCGAALSAAERCPAGRSSAPVKEQTSHFSYLHCLQLGKLYRTSLGIYLQTKLVTPVFKSSPDWAGSGLATDSPCGQA